MVDRYNVKQQHDHEDLYLQMFLSNKFLSLDFHILVLL